MTDESGYPSRPYAWTVVAILIATAILSYTDRQVLSLLVDPIRADLGSSDTQISLLLGTAFAVVYGVAGIPLGGSADRTSRRNLIFCGLIVWTIGTLACGFSQSFGQLFAGRLVVGLGEAVLSPAAISLISDYFPAVAARHGRCLFSQRYRDGHRCSHSRRRWRVAFRTGRGTCRNAAGDRGAVADGVVVNRGAGPVVGSCDPGDSGAGAPRQRAGRRGIQSPRGQCAGEDRRRKANRDRPECIGRCRRYNIADELGQGGSYLHRGGHSLVGGQRRRRLGPDVINT